MTDYLQIEVTLGDYAERVACFEIDVEEYPAEPYSWGGSRGTEREATARFQHWVTGQDKIISRKDVFAGWAKTKSPSSKNGRQKLISRRHPKSLIGQ